MYVCLREWVGCSGVHGVYYWSPAVLHLSLFSVVKHEAKSLLNLGAHSRTHTHTHTHNQLICVFCLSFKKYELTQTLGQQKCQYKFLTQSFFILLVHLKPQISSGQALKRTALLIHDNLRTVASAAVQHCGIHWFANKPRRDIFAPVCFLHADAGSTFILLTY